jgi:hypothetical protein
MEGIDGWTRELWRISQDDDMRIDLAGKIQDIVDEMRTTAHLPVFGINDVVIDTEPVDG